MRFDDCVVLREVIEQLKDQVSRPNGEVVALQNEVLFLRAELEAAQDGF